MRMSVVESIPEAARQAAVAALSEALEADPQASCQELAMVALRAAAPAWSIEAYRRVVRQLREDYGPTNRAADALERAANTLTTEYGESR